MRTFAALLGSVLILIAGQASAVEGQVADRIQRVEAGLMETQGLQIFLPPSAQPPEGMALERRMEHYGVPGVSIAVIDGARLAWAKGYGVPAVGRSDSVTASTLFEAASTTKLLVSTVALHYVEAGVLRLDEDVNTRLKSWKVPQGPLTAKEKVTLRRLLTHQSGMSRPEGGFDLEPGSIPTLAQVLSGEAPAINRPAEIEFLPGSRTQYSNFGFIAIQLLLEEVLGKPFAEIARETVFDSLGMDSSTLVHPLPPDLKERAALPHDEEGRAVDRPLHPTALGQGGLVTTPTDLARLALGLMRAYRGEPGGILSRETARMMFRPVQPYDPAEFMGIPGLGLGVFLDGVGEDFYFLYAGFNNPGTTSILMASPRSGKGAVVMANGPRGIELSLEILASVAREYAWPTP